MSSRIERFEKLVEMEPKSEIAHFGLGNAYFDDGVFDRAAASFRLAIELKPDYTAAYERLGRSLEKTGTVKEALSVYEKGVKVGSQTGDHIPTQNMEDRIRRLKASSSGEKGSGLPDR